MSRDAGSKQSIRNNPWLSGMRSDGEPPRRKGHRCLYHNVWSGSTVGMPLLESVFYEAARPHV